MDSTEAVKEFNKLTHVEGLKLLSFTLEDKTPLEFISKFIRYGGYSSEYSTVYPDGFILTRVNKRRSLQEIYDVIKTYFPELTIEEYFNLLVEFAETLAETGLNKLVISYCFTINRPTVYIRSGYLDTDSFPSRKNKIHFWIRLFEVPSYGTREISKFLSEIKPTAKLL